MATTLTNIDGTGANSGVYTFPHNPSYISPFPESNNDPLVFESGISFYYDEGEAEWKYIPSEVSIGNPGATETGAKITIAGDGMTYEDALIFQNRFLAGKQQALAATRFSHTYAYNLEWAERPRFVSQEVSPAGIEIFQYSFTFYVI